MARKLLLGKGKQSVSSATRFQRPIRPPRQSPAPSLQSPVVLERHGRQGGRYESGSVRWRSGTPGGEGGFPILRPSSWI
jgi:hypothetical protein